MAAVTCLLLLALLAFAPASAAIIVVDDAGMNVTLRAPARRIVTLAPHAAELVNAAGALARIAGVIKGSDYPPAVRTLPVVGDVAALDLERIVMLSPDLIVTWPWTTPAQVAWLRGRGIAVFEADPHSIDGIATDIERIGVLAGTETTARDAAAAFRRRIDAVKRDAGGGTPLRVFYEVSDVPLFTLGGRHLVSQAIALCGGRNVFAGLAMPAPQVSIEAVLAADPQVIIAGTDDARRPRWLDAWLRWPRLAAVSHHALYTVDANLLHRPGPRFVDGVEALCRTLAGARRTLREGAYNAPVVRAAGSSQ
jgi:iron complex transport system substrate-binding protein